MTTATHKALARAAMNSIDRLALWLTKSQRHAMRILARGEEGPFFYEAAHRLEDTIARMPTTYAQDGLGEQAIAYLHYFTGPADWYITEKDRGCPDDQPEQFQSQAFGMVRLSPNEDWELGYISIPELLSVGAELDLHFEPTSLAEIKTAKEVAP